MDIPFSYTCKASPKDVIDPPVCLELGEFENGEVECIEINAFSENLGIEPYSSWDDIWPDLFVHEGIEWCML